MKIDKYRREWHLAGGRLGSGDAVRRSALGTPQRGRPQAPGRAAGAPGARCPGAGAAGAQGRQAAAPGARCPAAQGREAGFPRRPARGSRGRSRGLGLSRILAGTRYMRFAFETVRTRRPPNSSTKTNILV
jgi:hypothetical protein